MQQLRLFLFIFLMLFHLSNTYAINQSTQGVDSLFSFKRIAHVFASADEKQVAFTTFQLKPDSKEKQWEYALYLRNENKQIKMLTKAEKIIAPIFTPDGKQIAYLAKGKKFVSIWLIDTHNASSQKFLELNRDIDAFKISPHGHYVVFSANNENNQSARTKLIEVDKDQRNARLYLVPLSKKENTKPEPLITNDNTIETTFFDWSPDEKNIVFAYQPKPGAGYLNDNKIAVINIATHELKKIPYTNDHTGIQPLYSHNGKWIAFQSNLPLSKKATKLNNDIALNDRICVTDTTTWETHCLANTFNENPTILGWNTTNDQIYVLDAYKSIGYQIYQLDLAGTTRAISISNVYGFIEPLTITLNATGTLFGFGYETSLQAPEAYISAPEPFSLQQVSQFNTKKFTDGKTRTITWTTSDGLKLEGLLITPANFSPKNKYPLLVNVHGGPAGAWAKRFLGGCDEYETMVDPSTCWGNFLSLGFMIFAPNPRGSTGYGREFREANYADFGGGDYRDIMSGVDFLVYQGIADPDHLAIAGWSFGGYMSVWAITQTNRFKAAVDGDGNTDFISFSGTSDIPFYYENYLGAPFWENNKLYLERAPIFFTQSITTPLLILHGSKDIRVPLSQSYELYHVLNRQKKPVQFVILTKQGHVPTNAQIIDESIKIINEWLKKAL